MALSYRRGFWPETVYYTEEALADPLTERVLARLPADIPRERLANRFDPLSGESANAAERISKGKRRLLLTRHLGHFLEACPGTQDHVCCNLWIVNPGEGCPMDCTYCYLQSYLARNPTCKLYSNVADMLHEIATAARREPGRMFRVGTGELIDSLVWDDLTDLTLELVPFFAQYSNLTLELKSKFSFVENLVLLKSEHRGRTVVSWSVNAGEVNEQDEAFTAPVSERIDAACRVIEAGYRVGIHFDPLVLFEGWQDGYRDLIRYIFSRIEPKDVAWVSISTLRYKPEMQTTMRRRFPESKIPFGEQVLASDRKLRYVQPLRFKLMNFVWKELQAIHSSLPIYMCMESAAAWRTIAGEPPARRSELVEIFSRNGALRERTQ